MEKILGPIARHSALRSGIEVVTRGAKKKDLLEQFGIPYSSDQQLLDATDRAEHLAGGGRQHLIRKQNPNIPYSVVMAMAKMREVVLAGENFKATNDSVLRANHHVLNKPINEGGRRRLAKFMRENEGEPLAYESTSLTVQDGKFLSSTTVIELGKFSTKLDKEAVDAHTRKFVNTAGAFNFFEAVEEGIVDPAESLQIQILETDFAKGFEFKQVGSGEISLGAALDPINRTAMVGIFHGIFPHEA